MTIRTERTGDGEAIAEITRETMPSPSSKWESSGPLYDRALRKENALSLIAQVNAQVVGYVAFSSVKISDGSEGWHGLGPVAVKPEFQGQGVARALIEKGIAVLQEIGAHGCILLGDPKLYERFGFQNNRDLVLEGIPQEYFFWLTFGGNPARGLVDYHEAFNARANKFPVAFNGEAISDAAAEGLRLRYPPEI